MKLDVQMWKCWGIRFRKEAVRYAVTIAGTAGAVVLDIFTGPVGGLGMITASGAAASKIAADAAASAHGISLGQEEELAVKHGLQQEIQLLSNRISVVKGDAGGEKAAFICRLRKMVGGQTL